MSILVYLLIVLLIGEGLGETYLSGGMVSYLLAATGEKEGTYTVYSPGLGLNESRRLTPYYTDTFYVGDGSMTTSGIETRSVLVSVSSSDINIYGESGSNVFNILPVSSLGARYVISYCHPIGGTSVLVVTAHQYSADIQVTFNMEGEITHMGKTYGNGDTLLANLDDFQTLAIRSTTDISGSVMLSSQAVAVFIGSIQSKQTDVVGYHQLLPVRFHGTEYLVVTSDISPSYNLQISTEDKDTQITFNNGSSLHVREDGLFKASLGQNEFVHFTTSRPVMTTMCLQNEKSSVTIPPLPFFTNLSVLFYPGDVIKIMTRNDNMDVNVTQSPITTVPVTWENAPVSGYKIGTCHIPVSPYSSTVITSFSNFAVLAFDDNYLINGGHLFGTKAFTAGPTRTESSQDSAACRNDNIALTVGLGCGSAMCILLLANIIFVFHMCRRQKCKGRRMRQCDETLAIFNPFTGSVALSAIIPIGETNVLPDMPSNQNDKDDSSDDKDDCSDDKDDSSDGEDDSSDGEDDNKLWRMT